MSSVGKSPLLLTTSHCKPSRPPTANHLKQKKVYLRLQTERKSLNNVEKCKL